MWGSRWCLNPPTSQMTDCCSALSDAATQPASCFGKSESPWPKTLLYFSHFTSTKPAWFPKDSLFVMYTPWPLYTTWLWKSHLASDKVLYSSRATVRVNGYKTPRNLRGSLFFFFPPRVKDLNLTRKDCHYFFTVYRSSLRFRPCLGHSSNTQMNCKD